MTKPTTEQHIKIWLAIIVIGGAILGYLRFVDGTLVRPILKSETGINTNYQTTKTEYRPGETVQVYTQQFCKNRNLTATTSAVLEDHILLPFLQEKTNVPRGCVEAGKELRIAELPNFIGDDEYTIRGETCYQANPLRTICYQFETNKFKVKK